MRKLLASLLYTLSILFLCISISNKSVEAFCFEAAAKVYGLSPDLLQAIARVESDLKPEAVNLNKDGSYDYGLMQINSFWYGILGEEIWNRLDEPCDNVHVGAWILWKCIRRYGKVWEAVGCYNGTSEKKRAIYVRKVKKALSHSR